MTERSDDRTRRTATLAAVAAAVLAAFWPVLSAGFVDWDDNINFLSNPAFRGLGLANIRWMFSTTLGGHYIPLTWLTLGADHAVWGMDPFGYHLTNLLFHAANALVLFFVLRRLTRLALRPAGPDADRRLDAASACGALLFALHPLRVESVAWITERRDMVSGFFGLLFLLTYLRWAEAPEPERPARRAACLAAFVLTALARPNCVTLLGATLILDAYPLRRFSDPASPRARGALREKLPFLLPAALGVAAVLGANRSVGTLAFAAGETPVERLTQLCMGLTLQVAHFLVPVRLAPVYGLAASARELGGALLAYAALPVGLTLALAAAARRWPAGLAAWAYYLLMLLPAHGSVDTWSVTNDRYSYLASLAWSALASAGLCAAWGGAGAKPARRFLVAAPVLLVLALLGGLTRRQCAAWHDTVSLWTSAAAARTQSPLPYLGLGRAHLARGEKDASLAAFRAGLRLFPASARLHHGLALAQRRWEGPDAAVAGLRRAIALDPDWGEPYKTLGDVLLERGAVDEALRLYERAAALPPPARGLHAAIGALRASRGDFAAALPHLRAAAAEDARDSASRVYLGVVLLSRGDYAGAVDPLETALRLDPASDAAMLNLGNAYAQTGRPAQALPLYEAFLRRQPRSAEAHFDAGLCLTQLKRPAEAAAHFSRALALDPRLRRKKEEIDRGG